MKENFPIKVLRHIAPFSCLRKINEQSDLKLELCKGVLSGVENQAQKMPNMKLLFERLDISEKWEECEQNAKLLDDEDLWDITNGHDICSLLGRLSCLGNIQLGEKTYRELMVNSYRSDDFRSTSLYENLISYQKKTDIYFVKTNGGESNAI